MYQYEASVPIKMGVMDGMVPITILALGTEDHYDTVTKIQNGQVSILRDTFYIFKYFYCLNF